MRLWSRIALPSLAIERILGIRVSPEEEREGLEIGEHANQAYPDLAIHGTSFGSAPAPSMPGASPRLATAKPAVARS